MAAWSEGTAELCASAVQISKGINQQLENIDGTTETAEKVQSLWRTPAAAVG